MILIPSADKLKAISSSRFLILEMRTPGAGMISYKVTVGPMVYYYNGERKWFPSQTVNLAGYIPAAGNAVRVLLYLDLSIGFISVSSSAEVVKPATPLYPDPPNGAIPSAYFYIEDTYTTLSMTNDYHDARPFLGGSVIPAATSPGQVIISDESSDWTVGSPMISEDDAWMVGDDDLLIVV